jgi:hypothetical protein
MRMRGKLPIFSYRDTFSLDATLAPIICAGLKKFKDTISSTDWGGYPNGFKTEEDWHEVLDKMIWSFENVDFEIGLPPEYWEEFDGLDPLEVITRERTPTQKVLWGEYMDNCEAHQEKLQEGFDLFAKHFRSLWW